MTAHPSRAAALLAAMLLACSALPTRYFCATFDSATSGGAQGYVAIRLQDTTAAYGLRMNWTDFSLCDPTTMNINYHIHALWTNTASNVGVGSMQCGGSVAGGHYDPTLQCTSASQSASTLCTALGRTGSQYNCTPALYTLGYWGQCEVGDLSAKFGALTTMVSNVFETDVRPPDAVAYNDGWASIVFHCPSARVLCGRFVEVTDWRACTGEDFPGSGAGSAPVVAALASLLALFALLL